MFVCNLSESLDITNVSGWIAHALAKHTPCVFVNQPFYRTRPI